MIRAFADATRRAVSAGARIIELHAAHGYLLHEFLSPLSNKRGRSSTAARSTTAPGSSARRWRRFAPVLPDGDALFVRISGTDWADGGWTVEDSVALARQLMPLGADVCDCSSGGLVPHARIPVGAGYQVPFAERVRRETGMPTAAVGLITAPEQAEQIVRMRPG